MNAQLTAHAISIAARLKSKGRASNGCPIDWAAIEPDYRHGGMSLRQLSEKHDCSHSSIANYASRHGWTRDAQDMKLSS